MLFFAKSSLSGILKCTLNGLIAQGSLLDSAARSHPRQEKALRELVGNITRDGPFFRVIRSTRRFSHRRAVGFTPVARATR